jgi:glycosyltransferase involved in cell wall biosynthesis
MGIWSHRQAVDAREAGADVRVLALERPIPPLAALRSPRAFARAVRGIAGQPRTERRDGVAIEYVRFVSPPRGRTYASWDRWARPRVEQALTRMDSDRPVDLVHAHYALPAGAAARDWARARGRPLVVSVHGGDVFGALLAERTAPSRVAQVLRDADAVLCNSQETLRRARKLTGQDGRMRVLRLGADAPSVLPEKRPHRTVATLGHVVARKRHEDVLRALARGELREARWVVIGDGPDRPALERLARELGVAERVEWLGRLDHDEALRELARCHVMALPSVDEAFGVAYVEAMACGVPAVGSAGEGGPEEIAAAGEGMLLVPPRDPAALAAAIGPLLAQPQQLAELSAAARATAEQHFTWARCGEETVAVYRDVLAC